MKILTHVNLSLPNRRLLVKTLWFMKITIILMFATCMQAAAKGYSQNITLFLKNASLEQLFKEVKKQTGYSFIYTRELISDAKNINLDARDAPLAEVLENCFKGQPFTYVIERKFIVLKNKVASVALPVSAANTDMVTPSPSFINIRGTVNDAQGHLLAGVSVIIKGTNRGTSTGADGSFSIDANVGDVLELTFVGYKNKNVIVGSNNNLSVVMEIEVTIGSEVVVVGYGTQKRKDVTGAISSISSADIIKTNPATIDQVLQGKVPGVQAASMGGKPGAPLSINIRGINSPNGNEPLYVIDGIPVGNGFNADQNTNGTYQFNLNSDRFSKFDLTSLNPSDIESIDILKDASATAIYGSRAANGVVVITTKHGKTGQSKVNFDVYHGTQELAKKIDMLDARGYMELIQDSRKNGSIPRFAIYDQWLQSKVPYNTNWQDHVYRATPVSNYNVSIAGATNKSNYFLSGAYMDQEGILGNQSGFNRYSLRSNISSQVRDWLKIGVNLNGSKTTSKIIDQQNNYSAPFDALADYPFLPVRWNKGDDSIFGNPGDKFLTNGYSGPTTLNGVSSLRRNPVLLANEFPLPLDKYMAIGNIYADAKLFKGLSYHLSLGGTFNDAYYNQFISVQTFGTLTTGVNNSLNEAHNSGTQGEIDQYFTYQTDFQNQSFTLLAGQSATKNKWSTLNVGGSQFPIQTQAVSLGLPGVPSGYVWESSLASLFGRLNYSLDNRYLLTATIRRDGSSVFGPNNKYAVFPSVAIGWRLSDESFIKRISWVSNLKVRASWGQTGAQNIPPYQYLQTISADQQIVSFGNISTDAVNRVSIHNNIPNADLKWESTTQINLGFDGSFFNNRVGLVLDLYKKTTNNLLLSSVPVPSFLGYNGPSVNLGEFQNKGLEIQLNVNDVLNNSFFKWDINSNFSMNRNKVVSIGYNSQYLSTNFGRTYVGDAWGSFYGYSVEKVFQSPAEIASLDANAKKIQGQLGLPGAAAAVYQPNSPQPGDLKFRDVNGDGIIDQNDQTIIGNPNPKFIYGLTNSFSYKNIDLSIFLQGVYGNDIFNASRMQFEQFTANGDAPNQTAQAKNRWISETITGDGKTPRAVYNDPNGNGRVSNRWVEDGSYLRIKSISLGYTIPSKILNRGKISNLRVYALLNDYFTISKYSWYNPDLGNLAGSNASFGVDNNIYPMAKTIMFGLNFSF